MKIPTSDSAFDDLLWEYNGFNDTYQGECEEILLEMQRIFYEDLRVESTINGKLILLTLLNFPELFQKCILVGINYYVNYAMMKKYNDATVSEKPISGMTNYSFFMIFFQSAFCFILEI